MAFLALSVAMALVAFFWQTNGLLFFGLSAVMIFFLFSITKIFTKIMASSSSSSGTSSSTQTSVSPSGDHDVFISFRGKDVRKTFLDHFYSALKQQGIYAYKDDISLPRGDSIGPSLLKAIQQAHISVVIFSKNYADSSWCLDELATIMECREERGQIVMPVFYDVESTDVRKQQGEFGEAFAKQVHRNNGKLESWRKALVGAANISGWEIKNIANGHESEGIKEIIYKISLRLLSVTPSINSDLIGMETRVQDLKEILGIKLGGVHMVGVWGVGGGGKTTLALSVYNDISNEFDSCCFVENVREESSKLGLKKLQEKILLDLLKLEHKVSNIEEGRHILKSRLRHKSVLIVLDDVDHLDQLKALAGSHDWFGEGSRIIITTRDNHLLNAHKVIVYDINLLNGDEAIELFRRLAPHHENMPKQDYENLSNDVISYARGLPLTIKVLGTFLCDKDMGEWRSALARLKDIPDDDIIKTLKISYDGLKPIEKELFLDIACFMRSNHMDWAMERLDACGFHPLIGVKVLIQKALLTISKVGCFDMHDLIQEMGVYIVTGEHSDNPEKFSRVWRYEDALNIVAGDITKENHKTKGLQLLQLLPLNYFNRGPPPHVTKVIANMKKLRMLSVSQGNYEVVEDPEFLSSELRWLHWTSYPGSSLPTNFQPTKLHRLQLTCGMQKQLWEGYKYLPCLKKIDLTASKNLIRTPDLIGLPNLEEMVLNHCENLEEIHPSIGHMERLVHLCLLYCSKLKMFPPIVHLKKLETLNLKRCSILEKFPEIKSNMDSLLKLSMKRSGIEVLPSSIGKYCTNLEYLDSSLCSHLKHIEGNFHGLKRLKTLRLNDCDRLEKLPEALFLVESCLEELYLPPKRTSTFIYMKPLKNPTSLEYYPDLPRFLRKLCLSDCSLVDGDITLDFGKLSNLKILDFRNNKFSRLHFSISKHSTLKVLDLRGCERLVELPKLPLSIAILYADECHSLEIDEDFLTNYKWLWNVSLRTTSKMGNNKQCGIGGERILQSMLEGNAIENHFISLTIDGLEIPRKFVPSLVKGDRFTLKLPPNWHNEFSGFLICIVVVVMTDDFCRTECRITIKQEMKPSTDIDSQYKRWEKSIIQPTSEDHPSTCIRYIPFSSLRHTTWWNSTYNMIYFSSSFDYDDTKVDGIGVALVPRKSKSDASEKIDDGMDYSQFGDQEYKEMNPWHLHLKFEWDE